MALDARASNRGLRRPLEAVFLLSAILSALSSAGCGSPAPVSPTCDAALDAGVDSGPGGDAQIDGGIDGGADAGPRPLDPRTIPQFVEPLVVPPEMPSVSSAGGVVEYRIAVRQFQQQVLPSTMPATTVWGYGRDGDPLPGEGGPSSFHYPAFTIEARTGTRARITWVNGLVDAAGHYLPPLFPIDATLHWANPGGLPDTEGFGEYRGPVPIVVHLHGARLDDASDGNPLAWYLPAASDLPAGFVTRGTRYQSATDVGPGAAVFEYGNEQRAATLWYHDHALGITRLNVYAGMAGFWLVRDDVEDALGLPGPAPRAGEAAGTHHYELPLAIQDRSFSEDGSLRYPGSREEFDGYPGPYTPETPIHPIWNPESFGDTIVVNGSTWPFVEVEPRLYRLRLLNGCNARFLILRFDRAGLPFHQIGNEGGLLSDAPVTRDALLLGPGERADVLVDFSALHEGDRVVLLNGGPDEPYQGPSAALTPADAETTGRVMQLRVVARTSEGIAGAIPAALPAVAPLSSTLPPRDLTLNEMLFSSEEMPVEATLGTLHDGPLGLDEPVTEEPRMGDTEIWRITNFTGDAHPIHLHLVSFQVLDRTPVRTDELREAQYAWTHGAGPEPRLEDYLAGPAVPADARESGFKDTVVANPGEVVRIIATFDRAGLYVWHCHILEHEDNEMMRPFRVLAP